MYVRLKNVIHQSNFFTQIWLINFGQYAYSLCKRFIYYNNRKESKFSCELYIVYAQNRGYCKLEVDNSFTFG